MKERVAVIGAGQAAAAVASRLRDKGFRGEIVVYGAEDAPPYQRPPLSKKYLAGEWAKERLWLRPDQFWDEQNITLRLGAPVAGIDLNSKSLMWNGQCYAWDKLVFATGASPFPLPPSFTGRGNVYELRTLADVERLRPEFIQGRSLLIVGGGYIGLETAAVAAQMGLRVNLIERSPRVLERVACQATADAIRDLHRRHNVGIFEGRTVVQMHGDDRVSRVELNDGTEIACDFIVVGIGVRPQTAVASAAGVACDDGILVDHFGRTSVPGVWAAGDCTRFMLNGRLTRLESVQNAIEQGEIVADDVLGLGRPYHPVPWFWSDQYDVKLQIVGLSGGYDTVVSRRSNNGRSHWYFREDQLTAVDAINDGRAYMVGKKLLEAGVDVCHADIDHMDFDPVQFMKRQLAGNAINP